MLLEDYLRAAFPDRHTILGVPLRDYSLGHELLLERIKSPFVVPGAAEVGDLFAGLFICSLGYELAADEINRPDFAAVLGEFSRATLKAASRPAHWWNLPSELKAEDAIARFARYVAAAKHGPGMDWRREEGAGEVLTLGSHPLHVIKVTLMAELHFTEREALSLPYALAQWNYVTLFETKGKASIYDRAERVRADNIRSRIAAEFHDYLTAGGDPRTFKASIAWEQN